MKDFCTASRAFYGKNNDSKWLMRGTAINESELPHFVDYHVDAYSTNKDYLL